MDGVANIVLQLALVLALVGVNGFFVAAEFALVKIRETQLRPLLDRGHRRARLTRHILSHLDPYLSANIELDDPVVLSNPEYTVKSRSIVILEEQ